MKANGIQLVSASDIAVRWGVSRQTVNNRKKRDNAFPSAVSNAGNGYFKFYLLADIEQYEKLKGIKPIQQKE